MIKLLSALFEIYQNRIVTVIARNVEINRIENERVFY